MPIENSQDSLHITCNQLADFLERCAEELISAWLKRVREDSGVPSDALSKLELVDHVPKIVEAMIQALRKQCSEKTTEQVQDVTARHTIIRWVQSYDLEAVLREVSLLRAEFVHQLEVFDTEHPEHGNEARLFNAATIHRLLDEIETDATETFNSLKDRARKQDV